jgi:serine beta-lactamase-like protein LACTB, mitochondrial
MDDTRADSATEPIADRATFYFPRFAADPRYGLHLMRPIDYSCYAGASAFLSTPSDLVRFGMAINSGKLLQPATVQLLQTPQRLASGEETGYGLGWDLETVTLAGEQTRVVGHDGPSRRLGGMVASLMTFPEHGIVVIRDVEHLLRGHVCDGCLAERAYRAGLRGTGSPPQACASSRSCAGQSNSDGSVVRADMA